MKRVISLFCIILCCCGFTSPNFDLFGQFQFNKLKSYLDLFRQNEVAQIYCIDRNYLDYTASFEDLERDYPNNPSLLNEDLPNGEKAPRSYQVEVRYFHDPSCYPNQVPKNTSMEQWQTATLVYDGSKWYLEGSAVLTTPSDDFRGELTAEIRAYDTTGYLEYDLPSTASILFRVHNAPVAYLDWTTQGLTSKFSYDPDGAPKSTSEEYANNKGIKSYTWEFNLNGKWSEYSQTQTSEISLTPTLRTYDWRVKVTDFDGAESYAYVGNNPILPPKAMFAYELITGVPTNYFYQGNVAPEKITLKDYSQINTNPATDLDDVFNDENTKQWTVANIITEEPQTPITNFVNDTSLGSSITTNLCLKNYWGLTHTSTQALIRTYMTIYNDTVNEVSYGDPIVIEAHLNDIEDYAELQLLLNCDKLGLTDYDLTQSNFTFISYNSPDAWGDVVYSFDLYSRRTGEHIATLPDQTLKINTKPPIVDFYYDVNSNETTYLYNGNVAHETYQLIPSIIWNDSPSIVHQYKWQYKSSDYISDTLLMQAIDYTATIASVTLNARNRFNLEASCTKALNLRNISVTDLTSSHYNKTAVNELANTSITGFAYDLPVTFHFNLNYMNTTDLKVVLELTNCGITVPLSPTADGSFMYTTTLDPTLIEDINYSLKIYSKRTGELLHTYSNIAPYILPLTVEGFVNDRDDNPTVLTDEYIKLSATTNKFAQEVYVKLPLPVIDYNTGTSYPAGTLIPMITDGSNNWKFEMKIPLTAVTGVQEIEVEYIAVSLRAQSTAKDIVPCTVVGFTITGFRISTIYDIRWKDHFVDSNNTLKEDSAIVFSSSGTTPPASNIRFGYQVDFEMDTIGLESYMLPNIPVRLSSTSIQGLNIPANCSTIQFSPVSIDGHKITWRGSYFIPYDSLDYRTYTGTPETLTISVDAAISRDGATVHFFNTVDNYAPVFTYSLEKSARDDVYTITRN